MDTPQKSGAGFKVATRAFAVLIVVISLAVWGASNFLYGFGTLVVLAVIYRFVTKPIQR